MPRDLRMMSYKVNSLARRKDPSELLEYLSDFVMAEDGEVHAWLERNPEAVDVLNETFKDVMWQLTRERLRIPLMSFSPQGELNVRQGLIDSLQKNLSDEVQQERRITEERRAEQSGVRLWDRPISATGYVTRSESGESPAQPRWRKVDRSRRQLGQGQQPHAGERRIAPRFQK